MSFMCKSFLCFRYRKVGQYNYGNKTNKSINIIIFVCLLFIPGGMKTCPYPLVPSMAVPVNGSWGAGYIVAPALQKHRHCNGCSAALSPHAHPGWIFASLKYCDTFLVIISCVLYHGCTCTLHWNRNPTSWLLACKTDHYRAKTFLK